MGPLAIIGFLLAGGAAMLPLLGDTEEGATNSLDDDPDMGDTEVFDRETDQVLQSSEDVVPDQVDNGSEGQREAVANFNVLLSTLNSAEWNSDEETVLSASDFLNLSDSSEGPVTVRDGDEADRIDASETEYGLFYLGEGDNLVGSNVSDELYDLVAISRGAAVVTGGASDEVLIANGDGATIDGGDGNDLIISDEGSSTLSGGEGDDRIIGNGENLLASTGGSLSGFLLSDKPDFIDGGAGDDTIWASNGDTVIGGDGGDEIFLTGGNAIIEDFDPSEDVLNLGLSSGVVNEDPETHASYNLDDRITLQRDGEELTIKVDGEHLLTINCDESTSVGYSNGGKMSAPTLLTSQEADGLRPDILIYVEHQFTS
ncbi:hypothetical protein J7426_12460 [Tropicibacter sp. R16_0]|uniref:calcium-binding protein n=1 Tax=Tropicibacter sp. R16_0 TaxID=2821102 RepID=UPI001ADBB587|nr:hypothetical protein [Tropicibacter sp. R16_0]MBO9451077.1 hypothetical protein [Tropicibacter sp. R16_0]